MKNASRQVPEERLRLSRSPTSALAEAALEAQRAAGLETADFVVIAVEPGQSDVAAAAVAQPLEQAVADPSTD